MVEGRTLDELPDDVYVALGRRGMEPLSLKECTYICDGKDLTLIDVKTDPETMEGKGQESVVEDWLVRCDKCSKLFTIRSKSRFHDGERMDTAINLIDDEGNDLGWLGSY